MSLRGRGSSGFRALALIMLLGAASTGCAGVGSRVDSAPPVPGVTLSGNYLAARHARTMGEEDHASTFLRAALEQSPGDPVLMQRAYVALVLDGRVADAVPLARAYMQQQSDVVMARVVAASGDIHDGDFDAAAARFDGAPTSPNASLLLPLLQAWIEVGRGRAEAAMAVLDRLKQDPGAASLYTVHAAWISDAVGDEAAAVRYARQAVASAPEPWLRLTQLAGGIFERAGLPEEAAALYRSYLARHPDSRLLASALMRLQTGKPPPRDVATARDGAAEALFDASGIVGRQNSRDTALLLGQLGLYLRPDFPELQVLVADLLEGADRYDDANRLYATISPADPLWPAAQLGIARNLDRMDRGADARALLGKAAAERPDDAEPLSELGDLLRRHEKFAEAVEAYDLAIGRVGTLQPRHWRLLYARGIALERSKEWARAEADFLQALKFEPDQPYVLNYLGYSWVEQGRNLQQAEMMIRKAVEARPNDGYIVDSLGWVLFRLGRPAEAVPHLERAVELRPEDPVINDHLGDTYWQVGRQREARFQWRAALSQDPEPELKATLHRKLERGLVREANALP